MHSSSKIEYSHDCISNLNSHDPQYFMKKEQYIMEIDYFKKFKDFRYNPLGKVFYVLALIISSIGITIGIFPFL